MEILPYSTVEAFDALESEWNSLLRASANDQIFLTWEWQSTWWDAYAPGELWLLAVRHDDGQLVGIAPWFIHTLPDDQRLIRSVGCVDVTDYLDAIVHQEHQHAVYEALANYLATNTDKFDRLDLCNVPETSPLLSGFGDALQASGLMVEITQQEVCPVVDLPDDFADYVQGLDKKQRHELRRKMRKIEGLGDDMAWYIVDESHSLDDEIAQFLDLMRNASAEKTEFLEDKQNVQFFQQVVPKMQAKGWLQMAFMQCQGEYAAAYINFIYNNRVLVYNSGLNPAVSGGLSPGIVLLAYLIRVAIGEQRTHYDFLRGNETYKYHLGGKDTRVFNLIAWQPQEAEA